MIEIEVHIGQAQALLANIIATGRDMTPITRELAGILADIPERALNEQADPATGAPWPALSPVTLARKKSGSRILEQSGDLFGKMSSEHGKDYAKVGTSDQTPWATTHYFGAKKGQYGTTRRGSPIPCPVPGMGDVQANWMEWPGHGASIISASGCGAAQLGFTTANSAGVIGHAGTLAPGGGGTGFTSSYPSVSAPGRVWGGGPGSGCVLNRTLNEMPDIWGGRGGQGAYSGGAGNPSGNNVDTSKGTGGCLFIFVRYDVVLTAGHLFAADGMPGEDGTGGGAGSGGGRVALYYGGTMTGSPNMSAQGGLGGAPSGGRGGTGATSVNTFLQMGWV